MESPHVGYQRSPGFLLGPPHGRPIYCVQQSCPHRIRCQVTDASADADNDGRLRGHVRTAGIRLLILTFTILCLEPNQGSFIGGFAKQIANSKSPGTSNKPGLILDTIQSPKREFAAGGGLRADCNLMLFVVLGTPESTAQDPAHSLTR